MNTPKSNRHSTTPRRTFGADDSALDDTDATPTRSALRRAIPRISFGSLHRPSFSFKNSSDNEDGIVVSPTADKAPIPSVTQPAPEVYATPLPVLSMIVLSITLLGEFLSANVSTPFLLFMVKGFGKITDEAEIAFWTGVLVATFFLTQFLTSLLWATIAEKHGRRSVLIVSLLGSAVTCAIFGTSTSLQQAICVRLLQGIFAGAVGVARGSVAFVTDTSNEGRAYAILGFCWGLGGVVGAIIGGTFERPADKWPGVFSEFPIFVEFPYLLPCVMAASVTLSGSILACFLGPDGGPRRGAIQLLPEKNYDHPTIPEEDEESMPPSPVFENQDTRNTFTGSLRRSIGKRLSGYLGSRAPDTLPGLESPPPQQAVPMSIGTRLERTRTVSNSKPSRFNGSAYGYGSHRNRLASNTSLARRLSNRRGSAVSYGRRGSNTADGFPLRESFVNDMNFAQRLLMANENAVTNIADLWVAAALNVDNENPFESDSDVDSNQGDGDSDFDDPLEDFADNDIPASPTTHFPRRSSRPSVSGSSIRPAIGSTRQQPFGSPRRPSVPSRAIPIRQSSYSSMSDYGTPTSRRFSNVPSIFSHPGVRTPIAVLDAQQLLLRDEEVVPADINENENLEPILESRRASTIVPDENEVLHEKPPSLSSQIPILVIIQYGLLALHSTTHDQIFMSYLVTDYDSGGLNLNAGHFAQLIALMCLAQIFYQFYLYPISRLAQKSRAPKRSFLTSNHVPACEQEDGNLPLMTALTISTALRFCGGTFAYTAISILLNYMTPPDAVGFANGIAQSIVSLARCVGPVMGGWLWSVSVEGNPNGYPLGFIVCAGVCSLAVLHSLFIR
ncbi:major facilitator superfamily MFS-1 [Lentinula edodes]|uniref:Major facilitator superfamily MFS-1 n=1 Tax=Lentinula edodes TaxID=5353 RepID=A0A1Q3EPB4_LENED|nr:major facilitator superfamily MFS-1 [Lentinula edodes]